MIQYISLTKREAEQWQTKHPPTDRLSNLMIERWQKRHDDELVTIIAVDGERIIGRIFVFKSSVSIAGQRIECRASGDLYVREEYRTKGIGLFIKMKMLQAGKPQILGGASGQMKAIYGTWRHFKDIDHSPIFQLPIDLKAILGFGRFRYYQEVKESSQTSQFTLIKCLLSYLQTWFRLASKSAKQVRLLDVEKARQVMPDILRANPYTVHIPWDTESLRVALTGEKSDHRAWIAECQTSTGLTHHLVCTYIEKRILKIMGNRTIQVQEAHLNEIYPPPNNLSVLEELIALIARREKAQGTSVIHIHANTQELSQMCESLGLVPMYRRSVFFAPNDLPEHLAKIAMDPAAWWCRANNERQFREAEIPPDARAS